MTNLAEYKHFGCGTIKRRSKLRDSVLIRARTVGIAGDVEALQMALAAAVGVYDQILSTVPPHIKPLVEGCGDRAMQVAKEILYEV